MTIERITNFIKDITYSVIGLIVDSLWVIKWFIYNIYESVMDVFRSEE